MFNQTPEQNRVEASLDESLPPPDSQSVVPPSSGTQTINLDITSDEKLFFNNEFYKRHYFVITKKIIRLLKSESRIWFLQQCLNLKILPNNSEPKATIDVRIRQTTAELVKNNLHATGLSNLKLGLADERRHFQTCKNDLRASNFSKISHNGTAASF